MPEAAKKIQTDLRLVPYNATFDPESHKLLPWLWHLLEKDDLQKVYFHRNPSFPEMVAVFSNSANLIYLVVKGEGKEDTEFVGFAILSDITDTGDTRAAAAGFAFLRKFWDGRTTTEAGKLLLAEWFSELNLDLIIGGVAKENRAAAVYLKRLGWKEAGSLPDMQHWQGKVTDSVLWAIKKEDFHA